MVFSFNFQKEEKLWSVFNLFKETNKNKNYITYDSLNNAAKALNLNINESEIKKCFEQYDEDILHLSLFLALLALLALLGLENVLNSLNENNANRNSQPTKQGTTQCGSPYCP